MPIHFGLPNKFNFHDITTALSALFYFWYYSDTHAETTCNICISCNPQKVEIALGNWWNEDSFIHNICLVSSPKIAVFWAVEIICIKLQKMQVFDSNLTSVQWSTVCSGWLSKLQWICSQKCNTVNTCNFYSEKVCSEECSLAVFWASGMCLTFAETSKPT